VGVRWYFCWLSLSMRGLDCSICCRLSGRYCLVFFPPSVFLLYSEADWVRLLFVVFYLVPRILGLFPSSHSYTPFHSFTFPWDKEFESDHPPLVTFCSLFGFAWFGSLLWNLTSFLAFFDRKYSMRDTIDYCGVAFIIFLNFRGAVPLW